MDQQIIDDILVAHVVKNPAHALKEAIESIQRAAYLLDESPSKVHANDQRLVAGLLVNIRILYLYYNDQDSTVDTVAYELALRKAK